MNIFIILFNNGELYEEYEEWIAGVFKSKKSAFNFGVKYSPNADSNKKFEIEQWNIKTNKYLNSFSYDKTNCII